MNWCLVSVVLLVLLSAWFLGLSIQYRALQRLVDDVDKRIQEQIRLEEESA